MHKFTRVPLYLGLSVFVFSVMMASVKLGESNLYTRQVSQAGAVGASLSMQYSPPDLVSVILSSEKPVRSVNITISYNRRDFSIVPESTSDGEFDISNEKIDQIEGRYSFTAITNREDVQTGILKTFRIKKISNKPDAVAVLRFERADSGTSVVGYISGTDILKDANPANIQLMAP